MGEFDRNIEVYEDWGDQWGVLNLNNDFKLLLDTIIVYIEWCYNSI